MSMKVVSPLTITDSNMTSNISEPDTGEVAWNAVTSYAVGQQAFVAGVYAIYQRLIAGTTATSPELDATNWVYVSPSNRWKMFDTVNTSQSSKATQIDVSIIPATIVNTLALFNLDASSVQVTVTDPVYSTVMDTTFSLQSPPKLALWYNYFFDDITTKKDLVVEIPSYRNATVRARINKTGTVKCGTLVLGKANVLSDGILYGATVGIQDYSRKEKDVFGQYNFIQRAYAKRADFTFWIDNNDTDAVAQYLADLRAIPTLYIGDDSLTSTAIFGFYKDFNITIAYASTSVVTLSLEGLT